MPYRKRIFIIIVLGVFVISYVFFALNYFLLKDQINILEVRQENTETNVKVVHFMSLFIKEVLQSDQEVDFETRLSLENAVRDLKDEEIKKEWDDFTKSNSEIEAQNNVKSLLGVLIDKIQE